MRLLLGNFSKLLWRRFFARRQVVIPLRPYADCKATGQVKTVLVRELHENNQHRITINGSVFR
jgi:hypothetical protein